MPADRTPADEADLRWAYRNARLERAGIPYETAIANPCLRACLELGAVVRRRRQKRLAATNTGAGIERSQPDFTAAP